MKRVEEQETRQFQWTEPIPSRSLYPIQAEHISQSKKEQHTSLRHYHDIHTPIFDIDTTLFFHI